MQPFFLIYLNLLFFFLNSYLPGKTCFLKSQNQESKRFSSQQVK